MADLKTNYVDDKLDTSKNQLRKYNMITNDDGTVSFVDVTNYTTVGTNFGAKDINDTNSAINQLNTDLSALNESLAQKGTCDLLTHGYEQTATSKNIPNIEQYRYIYINIVNALSNVELVGKQIPVTLFKSFEQYLEEYQDITNYIVGDFLFQDNTHIICHLVQGNGYPVGNFFYYIYGIK